VGPREARDEDEVVGDLDVVGDVEDPDVLALLLIGEEGGCGGELLGFDDVLRVPLVPTGTGAGRSGRRRSSA
jgi:hypothetical protein